MAGRAQYPHLQRLQYGIGLGWLAVVEQIDPLRVDNTGVQRRPCRGLAEIDQLQRPLRGAVMGEVNP